MSINKETQERINFLFKTNSKMKEKLFKCDAEAIREVAILSQKGISPNAVKIAYESGDERAMKKLYEEAKRLLELQELYKELCIEFYSKTKETSESYNSEKSI